MFVLFCVCVFIFNFFLTFLIFSKDRKKIQSYWTHTFVYVEIYVYIIHPLLVFSMLFYNYWNGILSLSLSLSLSLIWFAQLNWRASRGWNKYSQFNNIHYESTWRYKCIDMYRVFMCISINRRKIDKWLDRDIWLTCD